MEKRVHPVKNEEEKWSCLTNRMRARQLTGGLESEGFLGQKADAEASRVHGIY